MRKKGVISLQTVAINNHMLSEDILCVRMCSQIREGIAVETMNVSAKEFNTISVADAIYSAGCTQWLIGDANDIELFEKFIRFFNQ